MPIKDRKTLFEPKDELTYLDSQGKKELDFLQEQSHADIKEVGPVDLKLPAEDKGEVKITWKCKSCGTEGNVGDVCSKCGKKINE